VRRWLILAVALVGLAGCAVSAPTPVPPELIPDEPVVDCRAPASTCATAVNDAWMQVTVGVVPIAVQVVCKPGCTVTEGEADIAVRYSDGSTGTWTTGWSGAVPAGPPIARPPMPVAPTCQGVPEPTCTDMALSAWESTGGDGVVSIVVRCGAAGGCTPARGEGETTVTYADGRTMVTGWGYEGAAP
jgi:hypothetical protein